MKKKRLWLLVGMLFTALLFAFVGCTVTNNDPDPDGGDGKDPVYTLSATSISLKVGEEKQLTISPAPEATVLWETSNGDVATVANGLVHAAGAGSATVSAKITGVETPLTCSVTVTEETSEIDGYSLNFTTVSIKTGETFQLSVLDDQGQSPASVTWSSDDTSIATVSTSGLITAVAAGNTTVKATIAGGTLSCDVTVAQAYSYSLDKTDVELAVGGTDRLTLITTPAGNESTRPHTFTSSDTNVVTVEGGTGKLTGVGKGTAVITCSVDGQEVTANVTVIEYTVYIGENELAPEMTLSLFVEENITIEADPTPASAISATYTSSAPDIVSVDSNGRLDPKKMGSATITIAVGGRTFETTVTVEAGFSINHTEATLRLGATDNGNFVELEVTNDNGGEAPSVTFTSSDPTVATVSAGGLVTATGLGTATITAKVTDDVIFSTEITVVPDSSLAYKDYTFGSGAENLTYLDANKTIDWRQYYGDPVPARMANNANLIGDYNMLGVDDEGFWDYKAPVFAEDGEGGNFGAYTYGRAVHGSYTVSVTVTNAVSKIVIFTGGWKETVTVEFKLGDTVLQSGTFTLTGEDSLSRKYELALYTDGLAAGETLELTIAVNCPREHGGNASLVAVAVIGKEAHEHAALATSNGQSVTGLTGVQNVTAAGNLDWLAANGTRKAGIPENSIINAEGITYAPSKGTASDYPGATFTWTDGTANAPADHRGFNHADNLISIPVLLYKGQSTVTLFLTGWNCGYVAGLYDAHGNFIDGHQGADENKDNSVSSKVVFNVTAAETGVFTFKVMKCRGAGNCGWAAIAVSGDSAIKPTQLEYDLTLGGNTAQIALTDAPSNLTYTSADTGIVTVSADGTMTATGAGRTYITISDGETERRVFVAVTEYTLESGDNITLPIEATSQIVISANPTTEIMASYKVQEGGDGVATVNKDGLITAVGKGTTTITVEVGGKTFTITVTVVEYKLSETSLTLHAGKETHETEILVVTDDGGQQIDGVTFESSNDNVATVGETTGEITAVGVGTATITAHVNGASVTCTVTVVIPDGTTTLVNIEGYFENLAGASSEYRTLDYKQWSNEPTVVMPSGANLISEPNFTGDSDNFWDYKATIGYGLGSFTNRNVGKSYGKISKDRFTITVKISSEVSEVVFYTGAYKGKGTVTFKMGDRVLASEQSFVADEGIARKVVLKIDTDAMLEGESDTLTIEGVVTEKTGDGNINVVAVAVVGKTAYSAAASGTATAQQLGDKGSNKVNLTEVGTYDWIYSHYENPADQSYRKFNGNNVFTGETYYNTDGSTTDAGRQWDGRSAFKWTDGIRSDLVGTEESPSSNPADVNNEDWEGHEEYTNNYNDCGGEIHIQMHLTEGKYTINVYLNTWQSQFGLGLYDGDGNFIVGRILNTYEPGEGEGYAVTFELDVTAESTFKLVLGKVRSHDDGNRHVGWQAVAVAKLDD